MWPRLRRSNFQKQKGPGNKKAMKRLVQSGPPPGLLAYDDGRPVAWCALAPRETYHALANSRILKPVDDQPVWSVVLLLRGQAIPAARAQHHAAGRGGEVRPQKRSAPLKATRSSRKLKRAAPMFFCGLAWHPHFARQGLRRQRAARRRARSCGGRREYVFRPAEAYGQPIRAATSWTGGLRVKPPRESGA